MRFDRLSVALSATCLLATTAAAQGPFDGLHFRSIGPASPSGRIDDFAVLARDPRVFYVAAATGGIWKTTNGGITINPVFDNEGSGSVGAVAISPKDANLVWAGTGENNNRQTSSWGDGVYKSTDGGKSWKRMGLTESRQIAKIVVDPVDPDVVYVAALGDLWKAGGERGVYKTTDGGLTWNRVLDTGLDAGATELVMDPTNNKVLYAASYQRRRAVWGMNGGGPASGIWKSSDAGRTWTRLASGLPEGSMGRIGLALWQKDPSVVYARIEHEKEGGVYRSDDAGATWRKMGTTNPRPMYFGIIRVDPANDLRVYVIGLNVLVSDDGGKTFRTIDEKIHVDFHAMWINPADPDFLMIGGDGGVGISRDKGEHWMWLPHLPVGQFYHVGYDNETPFNVCGGLQDNNTWCGPSAVRSKDGSSNDEWFVAQGGDGFVGLIDPTNSRVIYAESQDGNVVRTDKVTNERKSIRPDVAPGEKALRWNWDTPFIISPHDPHTLYLGANRLYRTTDQGRSWQAISPDLTLGLDRDTAEIMGLKGKDIRIARHDGVSAYGTLFSVAESRMKKGLLYAGSDDGQVNVSRDGGTTWSNVTSKIPGAPKWAYVSKVEPSKFAEGTVYVTFDGHRMGDYGTYVYASTDYGASFKSISANLPAGVVIRSITEDTRNADVIYAGAETGLFVTTDRGKSWTRIKANLPTVPVYEITIHPRDNAMILATHGRALWILDDLTPIQHAAAAAATAAHIFPPPPAYDRVPGENRMREFEGDMRFLGENPPVGSRISYYLSAKADSARLVIKDGSGAVIRELKGDDFKGKLAAGVNAVDWDLRVEPNPPPRQAAAPGGIGAFFGTGRQGPVVMPGTYQLTLNVNGADAASASIEVRTDPEVTVTAADLKERFDALKELQGMSRRVGAATEAVREADTQLGNVRKALGDTTKAPAALRAEGDSLKKELDGVKRKLGIRTPGEDLFSIDFAELRRALPIRLSMTFGDIDGAHTGLSESNRQVLAAARSDLPGVINDANAVLGKLKVFFQEVAAAGLYPAVPDPVK
ncbi:MAG: glycosyl hydrolase [Gemmatimonadales bacterium]